jgi:hypothetical protein
MTNDSFSSSVRPQRNQVFINTKLLNAMGNPETIIGMARHVGRKIPFSSYDSDK